MKVTEEELRELTEVLVKYLRDLNKNNYSEADESTLQLQLVLTAKQLRIIKDSLVKDLLNTVFIDSKTDVIEISEDK